MIVINRARRIVALTALIAVSGAVYAGIPFPDANIAVTNWLVVVNYPEACASMPCTEEDIFGSLPDNPTQATVCYLTGQIVRANGKAMFAGQLGEGTSHGCFFPLDPDPLGLKDAMRAEVHVIVQEHGSPKVGNSGRAKQLTLNGGACNPDCADTQFATHVPADAVDGVSTSPMQRFSDESPVAGSISTLYRDRSGIRVTSQTQLDTVQP
jgi:hypothetical protein